MQDIGFQLNPRKYNVIYVMKGGLRQEKLPSTVSERINITDVQELRSSCYRKRSCRKKLHQCTSISYRLCGRDPYRIRTRLCVKTVCNICIVLFYEFTILTTYRITQNRYKGAQDSFREWRKTSAMLYWTLLYPKRRQRA